MPTTISEEQFNRLKELILKLQSLTQEDSKVSQLVNEINQHYFAAHITFASFEPNSNFS
ncbi:MAG TPA: hypothetical protein V6D21_01070 [Candidatus Obscuribacterales bacterium]